MPAAPTASRNLVASFCPPQLETLANKVGGPYFRCKTCSLDELHPEIALLRARMEGLKEPSSPRALAPPGTSSALGPSLPFSPLQQKAQIKTMFLKPNYTLEAPRPSWEDQGTPL